MLIYYWGKATIASEAFFSVLQTNILQQNDLLDFNSSLAFTVYVPLEMVYLQSDQAMGYY